MCVLGGLQEDYGGEEGGGELLHVPDDSGLHAESDHCQSAPDDQGE